MPKSLAPLGSMGIAPEEPPCHWGLPENQELAPPQGTGLGGTRGGLWGGQKGEEGTAASSPGCRARDTETQESQRPVAPPKPQPRGLGAVQGGGEAPPPEGGLCLLRAPRG